MYEYEYMFLVAELCLIDYKSKILIRIELRNPSIDTNKILIRIELRNPSIDTSKILIRIDLRNPSIDTSKILIRIELRNPALYRHKLVVSFSTIITYPYIHKNSKIQYIQYVSADPRANPSV